jgi:hypothetical protein
MGGAIVVLFLMFVAGPIGIFAVGAIWSAAFGWLVGADADTRGEAPATDAAGT